MKGDQLKYQTGYHKLVECFEEIQTQPLRNQPDRSHHINLNIESQSQLHT